MDTPNMSLKTRLSELLETLNIIILLYAIFLAIIGIKLHNTELVIETCIMFIVYIVFEYINYDTTTITNKGLKSGKYGLIVWNDVYRLKRKDRVIYVYTKLREKPYRITVKKSEDYQELVRVYKYMLSKTKSPERVKKAITDDDEFLDE